LPASSPPPRDRLRVPEANHSRSRSSGPGGGPGGDGASDGAGSGGGWVKRTSDDLRRHVVNFGELRAALAALDAPCLVAQLEVRLQPGAAGLVKRLGVVY